MKTLTITVPETTAERIAFLAQRTGKTAEGFAAELLVAQVGDGELNRLRLEIMKLREDVALATQAILVTTNGIDEDKAREWVKETMRQC